MLDPATRNWEDCSTMERLGNGNCIQRVGLRVSEGFATNKFRNQKRIELHE